MFLFSQGIHVEAFIKDRRIIQLNVTLLKPVDSKYFVQIASVEKAENSTSHCKDLHHCYEHDISQVSFGSMIFLIGKLTTYTMQDQTSLTFPKNNLYVSDHDECSFQNDCSYNVTVKAVTGKFRESVVYRVKGITYQRNIECAFM